MEKMGKKGKKGKGGDDAETQPRRVGGSATVFKNLQSIV